MKHFFLFLFFSIVSGHAYTEEKGIKHIVLCWLEDSSNPENLQNVMETSAQLKSIHMVDNIIVGRPVESNRGIVDDSFDVGLVLDFRNQQDLEQYLVHKDHVSRVKNVLAPLCTRILVYDIAY